MLRGSEAERRTALKPLEAGDQFEDRRATLNLLWRLQKHVTALRFGSRPSNPL